MAHPPATQRTRSTAYRCIGTRGKGIVTAARPFRDVRTRGSIASVPLSSARLKPSRSPFVARKISSPNPHLSAAQHGDRLQFGSYPPPPPPLVNSTGNGPSPGQPTPGVVKQDKSSGGSVDTTKTRSGPQRVRMSSGKRPIGAAKGKQSATEALCQTTPTHACQRDQIPNAERIANVTRGQYEQAQCTMPPPGIPGLLLLGHDSCELCCCN